MVRRVVERSKKPARCCFDSVGGPSQSCTVLQANVSRNGGCCIDILLLRRRGDERFLPKQKGRRFQFAMVGSPIKWHGAEEKVSTIVLG